MDYESEVYSIALTFGVNPDQVVAALTGDEDADVISPFQFVEQWVDRLDRDNARAYEDYQHGNAQ